MFICFVFLEKYFTKDIPDKLKMTLKGGAAVDPESGRYSLQSKFPTYYHRASEAKIICVILQLFSYPSV